MIGIYKVNIMTEKKKIIYLFKIRNIEIELPEPTMKCFEDIMADPFFSIFLGGISEKLKQDFQKLLDTKTYEILVKSDEKNLVQQGE